jgi:hypothetical protein
MQVYLLQLYAQAQLLPDRPGLDRPEGVVGARPCRHGWLAVGVGVWVAD